MGLDFSHCDASWGYGGFMRFRRALAREIGVYLPAMEGYQMGHGPEVIGEPIPWSKVHDHIVPLLHHSDCEGELPPELCRQIAPRLRELIADWEPDFDKKNALTLAKGMEKAASSEEPLEFR